jgi:hypothetical protein
MRNKEEEEFNEEILECQEELMLFPLKYDLPIIMAASPMLIDYGFTEFIKHDGDKESKVRIIQSFFECLSESIQKEWAGKYHEELNIKIGCECNKGWGSGIDEN